MANSLQRDFSISKTTVLVFSSENLLKPVDIPRVLRSLHCFFLIICFMMPMYPYRPFLFAFLFCLFAFSKAQAQEFAVYDSLPQLASRIQQAGNSTLVVNFWATWCKPCVEELPCFEELRKKYAEQNVQILLVSLDFKSQLEKNSFHSSRRNS